MRKEFRLRKSKDFKKVFKEGRRFSSPHFVLYIGKNTLPNARFGISISKSHFKLATRRNRLRRIAKEVFREKVSPNVEGYDFVVASRANYPMSHLNKAAEELKELILRAKG